MFKVIWLPVAKRELAKIWAVTADKEAVKKAAFELSRRLELLGPEEGESRANHMRITFEDHLGILFLVSEKEKTALIGRVWEFE
jgi:plasmid stabilization system protein ParE